VLLYKGKLLRVDEIFDFVKTEKESKIIGSLLVLEHGVFSQYNGTTYYLRSPIYKMGGFGNVVVQVQKNNLFTPVNKFVAVKKTDASNTALINSRKIEEKYGVVVTSFVNWTGNSEDRNTYTYVKWRSFSDYLKYIRLRLSLPKSLNDTSLLNARLSSYSGQSPGYVSKFNGIKSDISIISL
jgi:hypothetical protein